MNFKLKNKTMNENYLKKSFLIFLNIICVSILFFSCGGGDGSKTSAPTINDYITSGQQKYSSKDYSGSIQDYLQALTLGTTSEEQKNIYCYLGWAYLENNDNVNALSYFNQSINISADYNCICGKIFTLMTNPSTANLQDALSLSLTLLSAAPSFALSYYPNIKAIDIKANISLIYFLLEDYTNAQTYVDLVLSEDSSNQTAKTVQAELEKRTKEKL